MISLWLLTGLLTGASPRSSSPLPIAPQHGAGPWRKHKSRVTKPDEEDERPEAPEPIEVIKVGKAQNEAITGLVIPKIKAGRTDRSRLAEIDQAAFNAKRLKRRQLRTLQLADDEWLLLT